MIKKTLLALMLSTSIAPISAETDDGKTLATTVCIACHGASGISVAGHIPNLAGQRANYLAQQLRQFKAGNRKNESMQAIAAQLSASQINSLATYFSALPATVTAASVDAVQTNFAKTNVVLPTDFKKQYVRYHTLNLPVERQLKVYYANDVAVAAAKAGKLLPDGSIIVAEVFSVKLDAERKPIVGGDGFFVPDQLLVYSTMARALGWGDAFPDLLRNENWNYALYSKDNKLITRASQAECLACHKPEEKSSFVFTYNNLLAHVQQKR
ncbi:MAG: c-type cytochrome [Gammaproteobacteria bacterium]|nr:c-type cytochrome [Gammaproteobacteria bacterium]